MCDHRAGWHFKFLQCDHDRNPCKKKRVCSATVGWNDKPPVKADACAGRTVLYCRFCVGGVSSVFGLWTIIRRHDGEDVLVLHLSFHYPVIAMLPVFAVLGCLIPAVLYQAGSRQSIVERLREAE